MTDKIIFHRLLSPARDQVTGHIFTRCGLEGFRYLGHEPMPAGTNDAIVVDHGRREFLAMSEKLITCPKCRLRLGPIEKKILRLIYQNWKVIREVKFDFGGRKFDWHSGRDLILYIPTLAPRDRLKKLNLIGNSLAKGYGLTTAGLDIAKSLPEVRDEFDRKKK